MSILHLWTLHHLSIYHHVHIVCRLLLHSTYHIGVGMTHIAHRNTRHKIEVSLILRSIEKRAFGTCYLHHHWRWRGLTYMFQKLLTKYHN